MALEAKQLGNKYFASKDWDNAITQFTKAIELDPSQHIYFSNRSASYLELGKYEEALNDAEECVRLSPDWPKGYSRKGSALYFLNRTEEAIEAYKAGLEKDPENSSLKEGLALAESRLRSGNQQQPDSADPFGFNKAFGGIKERIARHPKLSAYLNDPDFVTKVNNLSSDPKTYFTKYLNDPKVMEVLQLLITDFTSGMNCSGAPMQDDSFEANNGNFEFDSQTNGENGVPKSHQKPSAATKNLTAEEQQSEDLKQEGNAAYKAKQFEKAIELYTKAYEADPKHILCLVNRAAVHMMQKDLASAKEDCESAIKLGREQNSSFVQIAKAYNRLGDIAEKEGALEEACEHYKKSLLEHKDASVKKKLLEIERRRAEIERKNYIDVDKALEHKERGNQLFQQSKFQEAVEEYTESIRRNPEDHKVYCNRAGAYSKLMAWQYAMEDCEKCIQLDPTFTKAYLRKGKIEHFLKEYKNAVVTFNKGLEYEPGASQIVEAKQQTMMEVMKMSREGKFDSEYQSKAMTDPLVQEILNDEEVREALEKLKTKSFAGNALLSNPRIMQKIEVLIAAGIVQMG